MKKGITKILSACVFAFVVFLAAGTQSKAAVNMGVKQTGAGSRCEFNFHVMECICRSSFLCDLWVY